MNARVGFVGIGNQGGPIAERILLGGYPLTVWARRPEAMEPFTAAGATAAASLAELGASCPMVAVCVMADDDVRQVCLGPDGLLAAMAPGSTLVVHSTVAPSTVRDIAATAAEGDVAVLDAPVSGGNAGAKAGTMAVLLGGPADVVDRWRPVLATFASSIEVLGDVGAGQLAKLVNNALSSVTLGASLWALDVATALGLDREATFRVISASSGDSFMFRRTPDVIARGVGMAASRLRKDLTLFGQLVPHGDANGAALVAAAENAVADMERRAAPEVGA